MDCISAVHFLAAFGIKDFQIYGLTTYGSRSSLCQAWFSEADNVSPRVNLRDLVSPNSP